MRGTVLVVLAFVAVLVVATTTIVLVRAELVGNVPAPEPRVHITVDADRAARHLSGAIETVVAREEDYCGSGDRRASAAGGIRD